MYVLFNYFPQHSTLNPQKLIYFEAAKQFPFYFLKRLIVLRLLCVVGRPRKQCHRASSWRCSSQTEDDIELCLPGPEGIPDHRQCGCEAEQGALVSALLLLLLQLYAQRELQTHSGIKHNIILLLNKQLVSFKSVKVTLT